jgi:serine/threonine protein kinase
MSAKVPCLLCRHGLIVACDPCRNRGRGGFDLVKQLGLQTLEGLSAIHGKGFVHGDLHSGNILITENVDTDTRLVKVSVSAVTLARWLSSSENCVAWLCVDPGDGLRLLPIVLECERRTSPEPHQILRHPPA